MHYGIAGHAQCLDCFLFVVCQVKVQETMLSNIEEHVDVQACQTSIS